MQQKLAEIKSKLDFLLTLQPDEIGLVQSRQRLPPFLDKTYNAATDHPDIMLKVFNIAEFQKDYPLSKDLTPMANQFKEMAYFLPRTVKNNGSRLTDSRFRTCLILR